MINYFLIFNIVLCLMVIFTNSVIVRSASLLFMLITPIISFYDKTNSQIVIIVALFISSLIIRVKKDDVYKFKGFKSSKSKVLSILMLVLCFGVSLFLLDTEYEFERLSFNKIISDELFFLFFVFMSTVMFLLKEKEDNDI
jgi:hypothetical protein